jgi:adenylate kinase
VKSIIISIHPKHVEKIFSGEKVFEYRKSLPKDKISHAVIYATAPISRIVAVAEVENMVQDRPSKVWEMTKFSSGITRAFYREYFQGRSKACAIHFGAICPTTSPINPRDDEYKIHVPQSYSYLQDDNFLKIQKLTSEPLTGNKLIFLGGIHGSGKTTICRDVLSKFGFHCESASEIIKQAGGEVNQDKKAVKIKTNQDVLINEIGNLRAQYSRFILDGHFCLINKEGVIEEIPYDVFEEISPAAICVLTAPIKEIASRLKTRDQQKYKTKILSELQSREIKYAKRVAQRLTVPFLQIKLATKSRIISNKIRDFLLTQIPKYNFFNSQLQYSPIFFKNGGEAWEI